MPKQKTNNKFKLKSMVPQKKATNYNLSESPVEFYKLLNEGLFQKYCRDAGAVQELNITYKNKSDIRILQKRKVFDIIEFDFIGNFVEEKIINADLSSPMRINTHLKNVSGTLFIKGDNFNDLILEF